MYMCVNPTLILPTVPSISPMIVSIDRLGDGSSTRVSWVPLTLLEARGRLTSYAVYYWPEEVKVGAVIMIHNVAGTSNTTIITELDPNKAYSIRVAARTSGGVGELSDVHTVMKFMTTEATDLEGSSSKLSKEKCIECIRRELLLSALIVYVKWRQCVCVCS